MQIAALVILAGLCIALVVLLDRGRRDNNKLVLDLEKRHRDERAELADRIQRPDILPIRPARTEPREPREAKDQVAFAQVGTVVPIRDENDAPAPSDRTDRR
jgi:hypothetical protein